MTGQSCGGLAVSKLSFDIPQFSYTAGMEKNLDLKPEEDKTVEVGFEKGFFDNKFVINAVGFYREEVNKIDFISLNVAPWGQYQNIEDKINPTA